MTSVCLSGNSQSQARPCSHALALRFSSLLTEPEKPNPSITQKLGPITRLCNPVFWSETRPGWVPVRSRALRRPLFPREAFRFARATLLYRQNLATSSSRLCASMRSAVEISSGPYRSPRGVIRTSVLTYPRKSRTREPIKEGRSMELWH